MKLPIQVLALLCGGSLLGLGVNALSPHPAILTQPVFSAAESGGGACSAAYGNATGLAPAFRGISVSEAAGMCTGCTAGFVDARPASEFAEGHIPNAIHLPPHGHPGEAEALARLRTFSTVVVYDSGYACNMADAVASHLLADGLTDVRVLEGAWPAWVKSSAPAESGACEACAGGSRP